jgi:hypothetical protein
MRNDQYPPGAQAGAPCTGYPQPRPQLNRSQQQPVAIVNRNQPKARQTRRFMMNPFATRGVERRLRDEEADYVFFLKSGKTSSRMVGKQL